MERERLQNHQELEKSEIIVPPAVESFSSIDAAREVWPENVVNNKEFVEQVEARQFLNQSLDEIMAALPRPDMSLQEAISEGHVSESQAADLYKALSHELESDPDFKRIVLYLPFEFLPDAKWRASDPDLQDEINRFKSDYQYALHNLLGTQDVRANFVDGDVMETELRQGDLPRVVKVAHMIPKLVEAGIMDIDDVRDLIKPTDDEVLLQSISEALPVLEDMGLVSDDELVEMQNLMPEFTQDEPNTNVQITLNRAKWLDKEQDRKTMEALGDEIATEILEEKFSVIRPNPDNQKAFVIGVRKALESISRSDLQQARELYNKYYPTMAELWDSGKPDVHDEIAKTLRRLHGLKLVNEEQLSVFEISPPKLHGNASENLQGLETEMGDIRNMISVIEKDPMLSEFVYPVGLVYGSRLKGYGDNESDFDIAVIVKPGTPLESKGQITESLSKIFTHEKIHGDTVQFWLEDDGENGLAVQDFAQRDKNVGESDWVNSLFGSVWEGDKATIKELREKLLTPYLYNQEKTIEDRKARRIYLEDMERENLQYRLMHKGYEKFFPPFGGLDTEHSSGVDGESTFWDSGYRMTATKLFASKVFLPKISREE